MLTHIFLGAHVRSLRLAHHFFAIYIFYQIAGDFNGVQVWEVSKLFYTVIFSLSLFIALVLRITLKTRHTRERTRKEVNVNVTH